MSRNFGPGTVTRTGNGWQVNASAGGGKCFLHVAPDGKLTDPAAGHLVSSDFMIAEMALRADPETQDLSTKLYAGQPVK